MDPLKEVKPIDSALPDSLLVTCASFEDRCLGIAAYGEGYVCEEAVLVRFKPKKPNRVQDRRRSNNFEELRRFLAKRSGRLHIIEVERHNPYALGLLLAEAVPAWDADGGRVTLDISCFTRVQLLFTLRHLLTLKKTCIRLIYTLPTYYGSLENKELAFEYDKMLILPFSYDLYEKEGLSPDRILVMSLGHEGGRALYAWRFLDPKLTLLIFPRSRHAPDLSAMANRRNRELIQHLEMGDSSFQGYDIDSHDIRSAEFFFKKVMHEHGSDPLNQMTSRTLYFMPGGPKPLAVGLALAACRTSVPIYLAYPVPRTYSNAYSAGFSRVLEYTLFT